jgi:hypothetical protein
MASFNQREQLINTYFTTSSQANNPSALSAVPNAAGRFNNDFTAVATEMLRRLGQGFQAYMYHCKSFFIRKDIFSATVPPYQVILGYLDGNGFFYCTEITPTFDAINYPVADSGTLQNLPMYYQGIYSVPQTSPYTVSTNTSNGLVWTYTTSATITTAQQPNYLYVYIGAQIQRGPYPGDGPDFWLATVIEQNETIYPKVTGQSFTIQLPPWLNNPYWLQTIVATEARDPTYWQQAIPWPPVATFPITITTTDTLRALMYESNQALLPTDGSQAPNQPAVFGQIELDCLDTAYIGNSSSGRILDTFSTVLPTEYTFEIVPRCREQTLQAATSLTGRTTIQYAVLDRFGQPFLSFLALYDVSSQVAIEARPKNTLM